MYILRHSVRELTKTFETYHRGPAARLAAEFAERAPKGEIVLLVGGVLRNLPAFAFLAPH